MKTSKREEENTTLEAQKALPNIPVGICQALWTIPDPISQKWDPAS